MNPLSKCEKIITIPPTHVKQSRVNTDEAKKIARDILANRAESITALFDKFMSSGGELVDARDGKPYWIGRKSEKQASINNSDYEAYKSKYHELSLLEDKWFSCLIAGVFKKIIVYLYGLNAHVPPTWSVVLDMDHEPLVKYFHLYRVGKDLCYQRILISKYGIEENTLGSARLHYPGSG